MCLFQLSKSCPNVVVFRKKPAPTHSPDSAKASERRATVHLLSSVGLASIARKRWARVSPAWATRPARSWSIAEASANNSRLSRTSILPIRGTTLVRVVHRQLPRLSSPMLIPVRLPAFLWPSFEPVAVCSHFVFGKGRLAFPQRSFFGRRGSQISWPSVDSAPRRCRFAIILFLRHSVLAPRCLGSSIASLRVRLSRLARTFSHRSQKRSATSVATVRGRFLTSSSGASSSPVRNCGNSSVVTISPFSAFDPGQCQALERRHLSSKVRRATPCRQPHTGFCWLRDKIRFRESGSHLAELSRPQRLKYFARQQAWPPILQASLHARTIADSSHCAVQYLCYT